MRKIILSTIILTACFSFQDMFSTEAQQSKAPEAVYLLRPAAIFDGESAELHKGWVVLVRGEKIDRPRSDLLADGIAIPLLDIQDFQVCRQFWLP